MRPCAPDADPSRRRRRPHLRLHGGGHDFARAPTAPPHFRWVARRVVSDPPETQPFALGFFVHGPAISFPTGRSMKQVPLRHFLNTQDWKRDELDAVLAPAAAYKQRPLGLRSMEGKSIALVFFNSSLRTRTSFELGAFQLGGHAVVLQPGKDAWPIEFDVGTVMDGEAEEHIAEVARVLSRYVDLIGVRAFPKFKDWSVDREDRVIQAFAKYASVPVINMETITHPCQELAHILALQEHFAKAVSTPNPGPVLRGKKYVLTWTYHPKPLNTAVANSALQIATRFGMDVTLLCPTPDYVLDQRYMDFGIQNAVENGGSLRVSHDIGEAYRGAHVVYAKSWGALPY